jgi:hypothetical protein
MKKAYVRAPSSIQSYEQKAKESVTMEEFAYVRGPKEFENYASKASTSSTPSNVSNLDLDLLQSLSAELEATVPQKVSLSTFQENQSTFYSFRQLL